MTVLLLLFFSCAREKARDPFCVGPSGTNYINDIEPIIFQHCSIAGCHSSASAQGGISLTNYAEVSLAIQNPAFLGSIRRESGFIAMPPNYILSDSLVEKITCWRDNGLPEN